MFVCGGIALPARFASCPPAAFGCIFLRQAGFSASSFTYAKHTGSAILRAGWRSNKGEQMLSFAAISVVHPPQ